MSVALPKRNSNRSSLSSGLTFQATPSSISRLRDSNIAYTRSSFESLRRRFHTVYEPGLYENVRTKTSMGFVRASCISALESVAYSGFMAIVISFNVVIVVIEANATAASEQLPAWIGKASSVMLAIFILDAIARIFALRMHIIYSGQDLFDLGLLASDMFVEITSPYTNQESSWLALRTLRVFRVVRVIRNFLIFRELYLMIKGLITALRTIAFASLLLTIIIMMFSILAVQFVHPVAKRLESRGEICDDCVGAYSSVQMSMLTMFFTIIAADNWADYNKSLVLESPLAALILIGAYATIVLGLLNLIVAVIVDRAQAARVEDQELVHILKQEELRDAHVRLERLFQEMDENGNGTLSREELFSSYDNCEAFRHEFDLMDLSKEDLDMFFDVLSEGSGSEVSYADFLMKLHGIKHANPHTLFVTLTHQVEVMRKQTAAQMDRLLRRLEFVGKDVARTVSLTEHVTEESFMNYAMTMKPSIWQRTTSIADGKEFRFAPQIESIGCAGEIHDLDVQTDQPIRHLLGEDHNGRCRSGFVSARHGDSHRRSGSAPAQQVIVQPCGEFDVLDRATTIPI